MVTAQSNAIPRSRRDEISSEFIQSYLVWTVDCNKCCCDMNCYQLQHATNTVVPGIVVYKNEDHSQNDMNPSGNTDF